MVNILATAIMVSTPLLLGAMAEVFTERSGVMLCAIEGIFLLGAWAGFVGTYVSGSIVLGFLLAAGVGSIAAALYGFITVVLRQQQVVTGTALNIFAVGFCAFFQRVIFGVPTSPLQIPTLNVVEIPVLSQIPFLGKILFSQNMLTYLVYILVPISVFVLYRTSLGLRVRSTGDNPAAVDAAGLSVWKTRFFTVIVSGALCGIAGAFYTVGYLGMFTTNIIGGRGWIAFAICFLGNWNPKGVLLGTLAFGLTEAISIWIRTLSSASLFPTELIIALPYILTIVLTVVGKGSAIPLKLGIPYSKED